MVGVDVDAAAKETLPVSTTVPSEDTLKRCSTPSLETAYTLPPSTTRELRMPASEILSEEIFFDRSADHTVTVPESSPITKALPTLTPPAQ